MIFYVNAAAAREGNGSKEMPFKHINEAAKVAGPGDEVLVAPGIYREYVDPVNGGTEDARITYRSEQPLGAVITGAEPVDTWEPYQGNVWVCRIDNGVFGNYNPYTTFVGGDWYFAPVVRHTGAVYLNDRQLYETETLEECIKGEALCLPKQEWIILPSVALTLTKPPQLGRLPPLIRTEWSALTGQKAGSLRTVKSATVNAAVFPWENIMTRTMIIILPTSM